MLVHLRELQRKWDAWGRKDPLWAAVTSPEQRGRKWDLGEFMRTGEAEVAFLFAHFSDLGITVPRARALDFGCGVGRHAQRLASVFAQCDGVDIAPSMLREARRLNRHPNCHYHLNARSDLSLFGDGTFSFVHCVLVLQHVGPALARGYLRELLRVLAPGGALVVQLPTASPMERVADGERTMARGPLPEGGFRAHLQVATRTLALEPCQAASIEVRAENHSSHAWPALGTSDGCFQISLGNRWLHPDGEIAISDDSRIELPHDVQPGSAVSLTLWFMAPRTPGAYLLELDMVQEAVTWFHDKGSEPTVIPCIVGGKSAGSGPPSELRAVTGGRTQEAWPHRAARLLAAVPGLAYMVNGARRARHKLRRWRSPVMEMHAVPTADVRAIIDEAGATVIEVEAEQWPGAITSCRYWVVKRLPGTVS